MKLEDSIYLTHFSADRFTADDGYVCDNRKGAPYNYLRYMIAGEAEFELPDRMIPLKAGEVIYIPHQTRYRSRWLAKENAFYSLAFTFASTYTQSESWTPIQTVSGMEMAQFSAIEQAYKEDPLSAMGLFYLFYAQVREKLQEEVLPKTDSDILTAVAYLDKNFADKFDVKILARMCNMSEASFYTAFKKTTGLSPVEYKNKLRAMEAARLLVSQKLTLEDIGERLGFSSPAHLRKTMKQWLGKTPREIKKDPISIL